MSPYLTKIEIDHETAFKVGIRNAYDWHQKIWLAFPGRDGAVRDFLTRLDVIDDHFRFLLLSQQAPKRPDWCPEPAWASKRVSESFLDNGSFGFSLIANPTKKVRSKADGTVTKNGRRVPITKREDLLAWIVRKAQAGGFHVDPSTLRTIPRPREYFIKKGKAGLHAATEFRGTLTVTDPTAFAKSFTTGIGPAKAFGFGMICLSPIS